MNKWFVFLASKARYYAYFVLGLSVVLRLKWYVENRSLFIDEANVARNIAERSFPQLFQNLDYDQYVPPLFSVSLKICASIFGYYEWALRLVPLLSSCIALCLLWKLVKRFCVVSYIRWFPLVLMGFSVVFIQYSTEVKQYSSDIASALLLIYLATDQRFDLFDPSHRQTRNYVIWAVLGAVVVWFSMPSVFFLAAIGSAFFIKAIQKNRSELLPILIIGGCWLMSFGLYYQLILVNDIGDPNLKGYHGNHFFPLFPSSLDILNQQWRLIRRLFATTFGGTAIAIIFGMLTTVFGALNLFRRNRYLLWILTIPILLVLIASGLEYYTLIQRLTLFFLPNLMLLSVIGTAFLFKRSPIYVKGILIFIMLIITINQKSKKYITQPFQIEELRPLLYTMKATWNAPDVLFVADGGVPAFRFYKDHYAQKNDFSWLNDVRTIEGKWDQKSDELMLLLEENKAEKVGLLFSHTSTEQRNNMLNKLTTKRTIVQHLENVGTHYYLLEIP